MYTYLAFYKNRKIEVEALTTYGAQQIAATLFKVKEKERHKISVFLHMKDDEPVEHSTAEL